MTDSNVVVFNVAGRTYRIFPALQPWDEEMIDDDRLCGRAERFQANLDEEEGEHILDFQEEIPKELEGLNIIFTEWEVKGEITSGFVAITKKSDEKCWKPARAGDYFGKHDRLIQRIPYGMREKNEKNEESKQERKREL